ncbi:hypothetical protein PF001_g10337 [Phytophthora fragariae]|uniref:Uncharacterized protein n=1 Tax=Phytophthora fragariae TaxID=53985 RepID=A0A6A3UCQ3_9STRA|nr:hypothetical protein PF006_g10335 [Phytophthora fragariae]KAE9310150.1 hypothetical protein PF001_g10337 [Phytophthora fragariae]
MSCTLSFSTATCLLSSATRCHPLHAVLDRSLPPAALLIHSPHATLYCPPWPPVLRRPQPHAALCRSFPSSPSTAFLHPPPPAAPCLLPSSSLACHSPRRTAVCPPPHTALRHPWPHVATIHLPPHAVTRSPPPLEVLRDPPPPPATLRLRQCTQSSTVLRSRTLHFAFLCVPSPLPLAAHRPPPPTAACHPPSSTARIHSPSPAAAASDATCPRCPPPPLAPRRPSSAAVAVAARLTLTLSQSCPNTCTLSQYMFFLIWPIKCISAAVGRCRHRHAMVSHRSDDVPAAYPRTVA